MQQKFILLINSNMGIVYKVLYKYCADKGQWDDMKQEIFKEAWRSFESFRNSRPFAEWLYSVARNTAVNRLRVLKKQIHTVSLHNIFYDIADSSDGVCEIEYSQAINRLTKSEQALIDLYIAGKSYFEMEKITGQNCNMLRVRISRIKNKLRIHTPR